MKKLGLFFFVIFLTISIARGFQIGLGRADVTGPAAEVHFVKDFNYFFSIFVDFISSQFRWDMRRLIKEAKAYTRDYFRELSSFRTMRVEESFTLVQKFQEFLTRCDAM
jgi:hypothetical protein